MKKIEYYESGDPQGIHTKGNPVMATVSEEEVSRIRGALFCIEKTGSIEYMNAFDAVVAELRALRTVADAAVMLRNDGLSVANVMDLESALRAAGRLP